VETIPEAPPVTRPARWRRWLLGGAALVVLAAGTAVGGHEWGASGDSVPCGSGGGYCFPGGSADAVVGQLAVDGWHCRSRAVRATSCTTGDGHTAITLLGLADPITAVVVATDVPDPDAAGARLDQGLDEVLPLVLPHALSTRHALYHWIDYQTQNAGPCPVSDDADGYAVSCTGTPAPGGRQHVTEFSILAAGPDGVTG
jgi:hypothetical protein